MENNTQKEFVRCIGEPSFIMQGAYFKMVSLSDTIGETVDYFLDEVSRYLGYKKNQPLLRGAVVYLKYSPINHTLVASRQIGLNGDIEGAGIDLQVPKEGFDPIVFDNLDQQPEFREFIEELFSTSKHSTLALESCKRIKGVFLFLGRENVGEDPYITSCLDFVSLKSSEIETQRKLKKMSIYDPGTHLLNRTHFLQRLSEEIYRGRRLHSPVSFLIMSIDRFDQYLEDMPQDVDILLKILSVVIKQNSRTSDIVGRMGAEEFGIILPHTPAEGAVTQAQRLSTIAESLDLSKSLTHLDRVTLSFGVSEYPSIAKDMNDLLKSTDRALYSKGVKNKINKILLAKSIDKFLPDFILKGKGL